MEQPKKEKKITVKKVGNGNLNGELELTPKEVLRNRSVKQQSTTDKFKKNVAEVSKVEVTESGSKPMDYEKKLDLKKRGSGQKSRLIDGKGNVIKEVDAESDDEKEMIRIYNRDKANTDKSRQRSADVIDYQTDTKLEGNPVYDKKLTDQGKAKKQRDDFEIKEKTKVRVNKK
jgi:hypothetical protein